MVAGGGRGGGGIASITGGSLPANFGKHKLKPIETKKPVMAIYGVQEMGLDNIILNLGSKGFINGLTYTDFSRSQELNNVAFHPLSFMENSS